jgi:UDP-glucose 4-epimerase
VKRDHMLLLGGAGFIGSALAKRLRQDGKTVHLVGRREGRMLAQLLPKCSTVIHLASATTPGSSSAQPSLEQANLDLTRHLVQCLQGHPDTHLIYFSSGGTVYGNPLQLPVNEETITAPISPHGIAKVAQENICNSLRAFGNAVTILRPSNAYGPCQTAKDGFGLVRTLFEHSRFGTTLEIWGDGENVRDYIHIDDIVEATMRLIRLPQDGGTYNLGSGVGYSINQVKLMVEQVTGLTVRTSYQLARGIDVRSVILDSTLIRNQLDWLPKVGLTQGLLRTWQETIASGNLHLVK